MEELGLPKQASGKRKFGVPSVTNPPAIPAEKKTYYQGKGSKRAGKGIYAEQEIEQVGISKNAFYLSMFCANFYKSEYEVQLRKHV